MTVKMTFHNEESNRNEWMLMDELTGIEYIFDETNVTQITGVTDRLILQKKGPLPEEFSLLQNYPNPFNPVTKIQYNLPEAAQVRLTIYDIMGREIAVPVNGRVEKGLHEFALDGTSMTSGVYIYQLETQGFSFSRKMILLR